MLFWVNCIIPEKKQLTDIVPRFDPEFPAHDDPGRTGADRR